MIYSCFSMFLTQLWIGFVSCAVYHIVPSPDHHCPVESCLTLSSFTANTNLYIDNNTSLIFQPGNHIIRSILTVTDVIDFSMMSVANQSRAGITCKNNTKPGLIFNAVNHVHLSNLKFFECYCDIRYNSSDHGIKLITLTASSLVLVKCIFENNVGTSLIKATHSNITIVQSTFKDNVRIRHETFEFIYCNTTIVNSAFINNDGPVLLSVKKFGEVGSITAVSRLSTSMNITGCEFRNNHRSNNYDHFLTHIIDVYYSDMFLIYDTEFISNKVDKILYAIGSAISADNCKFQHNNGSVMHLDTCKVDIFNSIFNNNVYEAAALKLWCTVIHIHGSKFKKNEGGVIKTFVESSIIFTDICTFTDNQAEQGGAIHLCYEGQCVIAQGATVIIANNTASDDGGGIYLDYHSNITLHSQSTLQILENKATENGGGIHASEFSSINLGFKSLNNISQTSNSSIYFYRNRARNGGGLYLKLNSIVYASPCLNNFVGFDKNSADYGGAVYVFNAAYHESTSQYNHSAADPECFFQSEIFQNSGVLVMTL